MERVRVVKTAIAGRTLGGNPLQSEPGFGRYYTSRINLLARGRSIILRYITRMWSDFARDYL